MSAPEPSRSPSRAGRTRPSVVLRKVLFVLAVAASVVVGVVAATVAAALALTASLPVAVIVWIVLSLVVVFLLVVAAQRILPRRPRPVRRLVRLRVPVAVAVVATIGFGALAGATVLAPVTRTSPSYNPVAPAYWDLSTGSRVAVWKTAAAAPSGSDVPIVYLHGGPGGFVTPGEFTVIPRLAETGHDVYMFDQAGGGYSPDLPIGEYSLERSLADIDAVRQQTGADRVIVVGHSAGGFLAAAYAADHSAHVEKAVFIAPGTYGLSPEAQEIDDQDLAATADVDQRSAPGDVPTEQPGNVSSPRVLAALVVQQLMGSDAALNLASQQDARSILTAELGATGGLNVYSNPILAADFAAHWDSTLTALRTLHVPTMLVRAQFDFLPWPSQHTLGTASSDAQTVYIPGAEHAPWVKAPELTFRALSDFILGKAQPTCTGTANPALDPAAG
ncbi:alpha/beta hydrolase [Rathayibacter sp. VKM Ac-2760]|uniref:alpha/beta fold hydrolase n=1 Tax=Rathayibacter sp. VKM Ac-2760 TaxID=2609253 RepID=UPI001316C682|nr:alpha/beta hydrolase [Rathayibacter sp. VKM Ac-2760]QHC59502.1 alpha/beta fold hydrolase [Rathayibacter sp. VKM Ac-2760]